MTCADPESFVRHVRGRRTLKSFLGKRASKHHQKQEIIGCQWNVIEMAFRWRAENGPSLKTDLAALWFSGDLDQYY